MLMAWGLLPPGPGPTMSTDWSAAAPRRIAPAASTKRGSFGRSRWVTAAGVGVAGFGLNPYAGPGLSESRTPANATFAFRPRDLEAWVAVPTLLATPALTELPSITVAITSPNPRRNVVQSALGFRRVGERDSSVRGGSHAYHRHCGGSRRIVCIGRVLFSLSYEPGLHGTATASATEIAPE